MKNNYDIVDDQTFDENSLTPSEVAVRVESSFVERKNGNNPVIELTLTLVWSSEEDNQQHLDKSWKWPIFFGDKNVNTPRILMGIFKRAGYETNTWVPDSDTPPRIMLPGAIKLLAYKNVVLKGKIAAGTRVENPRNFFNPLSITRSDPETGEEYDDALPEPVPNELVMEAYHAKLKGEDVSSMV